MREKLKNIEGVRKRFIATFVRYGTRKAYKGPPIVTLLFENVRDAKELFCDHIWFTTTKGFEKYDFEPGDNVSFDARVKTYTKGYKGRRTEDDYHDIKPIKKDYKLSNPNNILKHKNKNSAQLTLL